MPKHTLAIQVECLTFDGCPNAATTRQRLWEAAAAESLDVVIREVRVVSPEQAAELRFIGSPSIRINGIDIESNTEMRPPGLMCRTYRNGDTTDGAPSIAIIRDALRAFATSRS